MDITIRKATPADAEVLHDLYFDHLTVYPSKEEQDMTAWREKLAKFESNPLYHLLVGEVRLQSRFFRYIDYNRKSNP